MEALLNRYRNLTVLLVVIMAQLLLLAYQVKTNQDVRLIRVWAVTAVTPLARVLEFARQNTIGIAEDYFVLVKVREQNRALQEQNGRLKLENQFLKSELQTAERARLLSAFQERTPSKTLAARIIGNTTGSNARVVFIDRGSTDGVMRGMAVVTPEGIVGKVLAAYPTASQVQLITDAAFAAGVISQKNRVHGTVRGTGQSKCLIDYVQNEEKVDPGEMFYTSGDDRVFPKGMPVGTANVVKQGKSFKEIYLVPAAFQQGLEEVLVVLEGIHQAIPDKNAVAAAEVKILPPPPGEPTAQAGAGAAGAVPGAASGTAQNTGDLRSALSTPADRLKEKYKRIGEIQKHTFGEGLPGSKPPDFTMDPDDPKLKGQAPARSAAPGAPPATTPGAGVPPATAGARPAAGTPPGTPVTKPLTGTPSGTPVSKPTTGTPPPVTTAAPKPGTSTGSATPAAPKPSNGAAAPGLAGAKPAAVKPPGIGAPAVKPASGQPAPAGVKQPATAPAVSPAKQGTTPSPVKPKPPVTVTEREPGAPTGIRNRTGAPATPEPAAPKARRPPPREAEGLPFP